MITYPQSAIRLLPEATKQDAIVPVIVIFHTIVGSDEGAEAYMRREDQGKESHELLDFDASSTQVMPFDVRADCNWQANRWQAKTDLTMDHGVIIPKGTWVGAISVETEDDGTPEDTPWTPPQFSWLSTFAAWCNRTLHIPLVKPANPWGVGVGFHSMWGYNRWASSDTGKPPYGTTTVNGRTMNVYNPWTLATGKTCPGKARIAQFDPILSAARAIAVPPKGNDYDLPHPVLKQGSTGQEVIELQNMLKFFGWYPFNVDGSFGPKTAQGVAQCQAQVLVKYGLPSGRPAEWNWMEWSAAQKWFAAAGVPRP